MAKKASIDPQSASTYSEVEVSSKQGMRDVGPNASGGGKGGLKDGRVQTGKTGPRAAKHSVGKRGRTF